MTSDAAGPGRRFIAIDWSGSADASTQRRTVWLAEAGSDGRLVDLRAGRTRREIAAALEAGRAAGVPMTVGFDFAFSLPAWYLAQLGLDPPGLWAALAEERLTRKMERLGLAAWLNDPEPPFWAARRPVAGMPREEEFRATEREVTGRGVTPKSVFKLVGAGQVGRASLTGMQVLNELRGAGWAIWPFDEPGAFTAVEIYPRLLTGAVVTSDPAARALRLAGLDLQPAFRREAEAGADAFDAAISALAMAASAEQLGRLRREEGVEGRIWRPAPPPA